MATGLLALEAGIVVATVRSGPPRPGAAHWRGPGAEALLLHRKASQGAGTAGLVGAGRHSGGVPCIAIRGGGSVMSVAGRTGSGAAIGSDWRQA